MTEFTDLAFERALKPWYWPDFLYKRLPAGKRYFSALKVLHDHTNGLIAQSVSASPSYAVVLRGRVPALIASHTRTHAHRIHHHHTRRRHQLAAGEADASAPAENFLDMLLKVRDVAGKPLSDQGVREEVDTFVFEGKDAHAPTSPLPSLLGFTAARNTTPPPPGHDTTAAAITWAIYLIGSYPEVQRALRREADAVLGDATQPTYEQLKQYESAAAATTAQATLGCVIDKIDWHHVCVQASLLVRRAGRVHAQHFVCAHPRPPH